MGFGEILQWLQDNHMGDMAIEVARTGVEDMNTLRNMTIDTMKAHGVSMTNISRLWEGIHGHEIIEDFDHTPITQVAEVASHGLLTWRSQTEKTPS